MNSSQPTAPSTIRTVVEYGIRFTVIGAPVGWPTELKRRVRYKTCGVNRVIAAENLAAVRAWQEHNPLCPQVDAVIVTRTLTYSEWSEPTVPPRDVRADHPDPDAAYKQAIEADLPGGAA